MLIKDKVVMTKTLIKERITLFVRPRVDTLMESLL